MTQTEQEIAQELGIRVIGEGEYGVQSSDGTREYTVRFVGRTEDGDGLLWDCDCPARTTCKHIRLVGELSNRVTAELGED